MNTDVTIETEAGKYTGTARDISIGGMFVETELKCAFGQEITITTQLPTAKEQSRFPATVRWTAPGGLGVQFGLLGARDTHAIVQLIKP